MRRYIRPILNSDPSHPQDAVCFAKTHLWFDQVEILSREQATEIKHVSDCTEADLLPLRRERSAIFGLSMSTPQIMGIVNATPDSFSDGGKYAAADNAIAHAASLVNAGARIIDIGGESTRPGSDTVPIVEECERVAPVVDGVRAQTDVLVSIDTRKAEVARVAIAAGARLVNDVSGFTFDADLAPLCAENEVAVCIMHALGDPKTMQQNPQYDDVLLDVYDFLEARIEALVSIGVPKAKITIDPGIGFGKTLEHNLVLLRRISLFHSLGVPVLLGASRKRFIGTLSNAPEAADRMAGSVAVALNAVAQGVQIVRVHDVLETVQALALWQAVEGS